MTHRWEVRVYYEDTDLAGIVYYANYLRYIERARTEWVRSLGIDQARLKAEEGIVFAVRRVEADYLSPARFDDVVVGETRLRDQTGARIVLEQDVLRGETRLFAGVVTLVARGADGRPARLPQALRARMEAELDPGIDPGHAEN
jgi:acyl-CoA thioester hydrolase